MKLDIDDEKQVIICGILFHQETKAGICDDDATILTLITNTTTTI